MDQCGGDQASQRNRWGSRCRSEIAVHGVVNPLVEMIGGTNRRATEIRAAANGAVFAGPEVRGSGETRDRNESARSAKFA